MGNSTPDSLVSLARVTINAPADKVYKELAECRGWQPWLTAAKVLLPPGNHGALQAGDGFTYTAKYVPGFVSAKVGAVVDGEVLEWSENVAFGLVRGAHIFRVHQQRPQRRWGLLPGRVQTQVLLSLEVAGPCKALVKTESLEQHVSQWLLDLKAEAERA